VKQDFKENFDFHFNYFLVAVLIVFILFHLYFDSMISIEKKFEKKKNGRDDQLMFGFKESLSLCEYNGKGNKVLKISRVEK